MNYLSVGTDAKTVKGEKNGYLTGILYLAPAQEAGGETICPFSTAGCRRVCLFTAGRGVFESVRNARIKKTLEFQQNPELFVTKLQEDVAALEQQARQKHMHPAVRLNGTSDILWEKYRDRLMDFFPEVQFYDYTKYPAKLRKELPSNYHLTYSFSEKSTSPIWSLDWAKRGFNTAVVFRIDKAHSLPQEFRILQFDRPVIDGDLTDLRFTDPKGVIVGLKVKGKARKDDGDGFVQMV